ncbi:MAG TPA: 3-dehydroquinate synthase [Blastocatellia bacterium]|nr:3-dehydroquinate synthase [Blastocatellia bacterium]
METATIRVKLKQRSYAIHVAAGLLDEVGDLLRAAVGERARRAVVVSNPTVDQLYGRRLARSLRRAGFKTPQVLIGDGERFKTLGTAETLYTFLIEQRIERSDVIVAMGGGVVGDLSGFVAATYLRGIRFAQVPTTLLAQIDSSVGGKTGVNHRLGKNLIGAFHQPALVAIDPLTLQSLPGRELRAGLCEAIKYGVIRDRRLFDRIYRELDRLKLLDLGELTHLIERSCQIKAEVVARDEREGGLRRILNFGHTVGHALEAVTRYRRFLHGEAVGHGMRAAARLAERLEMLASDERRLIDEAVRRAGPLPSAKTLALDDIISAMAHDKKAEAGQLAFVLPTQIGRVVVRADVPLQIIRAALKDALFEQPLS